MRQVVKLPKLGDTADEVVVLEWLVEVGGHVRSSDPLLRVETSKVNADVPSPVSGVLAERLVQPGEEIGVGTPLAVVEST